MRVLVLLVLLGVGSSSAGLVGLLDGVQQCNKHTACSSVGETCCPAAYSGSGMGCCTLPNAVCCPNKQTCCPSGTTCKDSGTYLTECIDASGNVQSQGTSVCKPGPAKPPSKTLPNCLILGDSVSIGYTLFVAKLMETECLVQHAPYDFMDGGAEETAYCKMCMDVFLRSALDAAPFPADVIWFNSGLHNIDPDGPWTPGQSGDPRAYATELKDITEALQKTGASLVYGLTTPVPYNATMDDGVQHTLNDAARKIMSDASIPVVDLHKVVTDVCGPAPFECSIALNKKDSPNLHYKIRGYELLAQHVADGLRQALKKKKEADSVLIV